MCVYIYIYVCTCISYIYYDARTHHLNIFESMYIDTRYYIYIYICTQYLIYVCTHMLRLVITMILLIVSQDGPTSFGFGNVSCRIFCVPHGNSFSITIFVVCMVSIWSLRLEWPFWCESNSSKMSRNLLFKWPPSRPASCGSSVSYGSPAWRGCYGPCRSDSAPKRGSETKSEAEQNFLRVGRVLWWKSVLDFPFYRDHTQMVSYFNQMAKPPIRLAKEEKRL